MSLRYSSAQREICSFDESKLLVRVSPKSIQKFVNILEPKNQVLFPLNENSFSATTKQLSIEQKNNFLSKFVAEGWSFDCQSDSFLLSLFQQDV